jgi:hypothetical protein
MRVINAGRGGRLRVWTWPDAPIPEADATICVEWMGRLGHPTSYAMVGGKLAGNEDDHDACAHAGPWPKALPGRHERITFGLPEEYHAAVRDAAGPELLVTIAASGPVSSSEVAFGWVTSLVRRLVLAGVPDDTAQLIAAWNDLRRLP